MLLPLLLLLLVPMQEAVPADVQVLGPGKPNGQTPATMMVEPAAMFIVACDTDEDGRTSRAELDACVVRSFDLIDTGHAGQIGYVAYADWQKRWLGDQGTLPSPFEVDRDGDDRITAIELQAQFAKLFSRFDGNGDRAVTRAEALTIRATAAGGRGSRSLDGERGGRRRPPAGGERVPRGKPGEGAPAGNGRNEDGLDGQK